MLGKRKRIESSERNERGGPNGVRNDAARSRSSGKSSARSRESSQKSLKSYSSSKERVKGKKERILESRNNSGERNISYVVQRSQSQEPPAVLTTFTNAMTETIPLLTSLTQLLEKKAVLESVDSIIIQGLMQTARRNVLRRVLWWIKSNCRPSLLSKAEERLKVKLRKNDVGSGILPNKNTQQNTAEKIGAKDNADQSKTKIKQEKEAGGMAGILGGGQPEESQQNCQSSQTENPSALQSPVEDENNEVDDDKTPSTPLTPIKQNDTSGIEYPNLMVNRTLVNQGIQDKSEYRWR